MDRKIVKYATTSGNVSECVVDAPAPGAPGATNDDFLAAAVLMQDAEEIAAIGVAIKIIAIEDY